MGETVWVVYEDQEWEWSDATQYWTGSARPLTDERRYELAAHQLRAEEIARSWGWNGERGADFEIMGRGDSIRHRRAG